MTTLDPIPPGMRFMPGVVAINERELRGLVTSTDKNRRAAASLVMQAIMQNIKEMAAQ